MSYEEELDMWLDTADCYENEWAFERAQYEAEMLLDSIWG